MMQSNRILRWSVISILILLIGLLSLSFTIPITAQDGSFATNTPQGQSATTDDTGSAPSFATNTPQMSSTANRPEDILFNYGLRFWLEPEFASLVFDQIALIEGDDVDRQLAANILLYEMESRFPNAPSDPMQRLQLINAMLNAPAGSLDMRRIVYPLFQDALDANVGEIAFEVEGFSFDITLANLDGDDILDGVLHALYLRDDQVFYDEYLLVIGTASGAFSLLETTYDLPAAPFGNIQSISIEQIHDVNGDSLGELVLRVDDGQASDRFLIIEQRNGRAVDLIDPSLELRVGLLINWALDDGAIPELTVLEYQTLSDYPDWQCISEIEYSWRYERNLYRRSVELNEVSETVDSLGCVLRDVDLFGLSPSDAITEVESALLTYGFEAPSANRALMTLSMLYVLTGRLDDARNTAQSIVTAGDDSTWESQQATALITASNFAGNTALDICEALAIASEAPACDMNAVLGRYLNALLLETDEDIFTQLEDASLPVIQSETVSEVGRADRIAIQFGLFDTDWWGFYDARDGTYNVEPVAAPISFGEVVLPEAQLSVPESAFDALLLDNDPSRTLTIIDNTQRSNDPNIPLRPSALYLQALAYEFTGDRENARAAYYELWDRYGESVWGVMASEHLELR